MKLSVAPESTKMFLSAMACKVLSKTGTFREWYLVIYTDFQPIALAQAVGSSVLKILFHEELLDDGVLCIVFCLPQYFHNFGSGVFLLSTSYFGWFFIIAVDLFNL